MKDGGPAFPASSDTKMTGGLLHPQGMSLRDYFAAAATLTSWEYDALEEEYQRNGVTPARDMEARIRGAKADAMLAERAKEQK